MCVLCKGCALSEEAKVPRQQPAAASGKKKTGKGKKKQEHTPTVGMNCKRLNKTPVEHLQLDIALMMRVDGSHAASAAAVPLCEHCAAPCFSCRTTSTAATIIMASNPTSMPAIDDPVIEACAGAPEDASPSCMAAEDASRLLLRWLEPNIPQFDLITSIVSRVERLDGGCYAGGI